MEPQQEPTLEESIKQVMQTLPPPIRNYLGQGKYSVVAKSLMTKYGLHVDQGSILEREIMLLLMNVENPEEFTSSLKSDASIPEDVVWKIMIDINQEIFMPLREQMRSGAGNAQPIQSAEPIKPTPPHNEPSFTNPTPANPQFPRPVEVPNVRMSPPPRTQEVNASTPKYFHLENKIVTPTQPSAVPTPSPVVPNNGLADALKQVLHKEDDTAVNPNEKLLEDHEEPHIEIDKTSVPPNLPGAPVSQVIQPGVRFSPRLAVTPSEGGPIAHEDKPSPILPKAEPLAPSIPPELPKPIPPVVSPVAPVTPTPSTPSRPYSTDPYREPIDEK